MSKKFFSIIITTYNRYDELEKTIESLSHQTFKDFEVCILDNNSTEPIENLTKKFKNVKVLKLKENTAICAINNAGKIATGEYYVLMDNDTHYEKDALKKFHDLIKAEKIEATAPKIIQYYYDKEIYLPHYIDENGNKIAPYFSGCGFAISKKLFREIMKKYGAFHDEKLFIYYGELDASAKIYKLGRKIYYHDEIVNFHRWKATQPDRNKKVVDRDFYKYRNYFYLTLKYAKTSRKIALIPPLFISFLLLSVKNKNPSTFIKGFSAGLKMKTKEKICPLNEEELKSMNNSKSYFKFFVGLLYKNLFAKIFNKKYF